MQYGPIQKGQFLRRLNRFSALVRIDGIEELCPCEKYRPSGRIAFAGSHGLFGAQRQKRTENEMGPDRSGEPGADCEYRFPGP